MSLPDVDKNDVDISKLFKFSHSFEVEADGNSITFYQRLVSDEHSNKARAYGLRESAKLRANLNDPEFEDRDSFVPPLRDLDDDKIIETIAGFSIREIFRVANQRVMNEIKIPEEPTGEPTLEEKEAYQVAVDKYPDEYSKLLELYTGEELEKVRKDLKKVPVKQLVNNYEAVLINEHCEAMFAKAFRECVVYYGTYVDETFSTRTTPTLESFVSLPSTLKDLLSEKYSELEINAPELKK